jgi:8-oxo-dGTP pyrophosphatase MutT (NUDIX family)
MTIRFDGDLRARIAANLSGFERRPIGDPKMRAAAVAIVVVHDAVRDAAAVLLTRRPDNLRRHGGQFALPGGRLDPGETPVDAALRELDEELGLALRPDEVIGQLDDFGTRSGFRITPVVAWAEGAEELKPDPVEVFKVFHVPLTDLESPEIPYLEQTTDGEHPVMSATLKSLGHRVYAPTAAMLYQFREVALRGLATRVAHFDQPRFAWR